MYPFTKPCLFTIMPLGRDNYLPVGAWTINRHPSTPRNPKIDLCETLAYVYDYDYELGFIKAPLTFV